MTEQHKLAKDGVLNDGVSHYPADAHDLQTYKDAQSALAQHRVPLLLHANNPHERLFVASFDGTGNDAVNDPEHQTSVARFNHQIKELGDAKLFSNYVEGPGTQKNFFVRTWDGARGHTYDERLERMYEQFIKQAWEWRREDPNVEIRVADIGFSRGAEQAAGFARLVHERGIQDPSGIVRVKNAQGELEVQYTKPPLVPPGQTAQAVGLFDPVGTGEPVNKHDRRLPPSVISGFQITAEDERRSLFKSSRIMDPGFTMDGRFLNVMVGGAHSDIGGSYHRDGLGVRSENLMADYLNALSDRPFLNKRAEPDDPRLNVVHRSEEAFPFVLAPRVDRRLPEGNVERLVPKDRLKEVADGYNAEPRDEALAGRFEFRETPIATAATAPTRTVQGTDDPAALVDRFLAAAASGDRDAFRDATRTAADHTAARELREHATATVDQQQAAAQQVPPQQQDVQPPEPPARRPAAPMH
ncbi:phospholipase effector Tle1 domain-containing protein [Lysobacter tyrosinilyticus]